MKLTDNSTYRADIDLAVETLRKGGIILYPTDTIWGIGCDARNSEAVKKIFNLKKRADSKSMLVLVNNEVALERCVEDVPEIAWDLIDAAVNPLTIIYDKAKGLAPELVAPDGSIGVRITKEPFSNELCRLLGAPIVSTSANISGRPSPKTFGEISGEVKDGVDYIVAYRRTDSTPASPSNIIKVSEGGIVRIIR